MNENKEMVKINSDSLFHKEARNCWLSVSRYYAMNFDCFNMAPHTHGAFEIMYVASGSCNIYSWNEDNQSENWSLKEGEYVVIESNTKHQLEVVRGVPCRILNLEMLLRQQTNGMRLQQLYEQSKSVHDFLNMPVSIYRHYDAEGNLHNIMKELHIQLQNPLDEAEHNIMQNLILTQLIIELGRQRTKKHRTDDGSKYVRRALTFLNEHYEQDIKIEDIGKAIGISSAYLQRLFKLQTGSTLVDKMNEFRIEKAKLLLETSKLPILDIAISVGFHNRQHFTYTFRKLTGCSPSVYCKHKGDYQIML